MTRPTNINSLRAAAAKRKRESLVQNIVLGLIAVPVVIAIIAVIVVLGGLITLFGWNVGVVGVAAALGAKVSLINLWTAIGANVALGIIGRAFKTTPTTVNNQA